ncbi:ABC transporter permease [Parapedobacter tibetensis]|uniref:ABC transporter permease n=1 Tax=Parapedobacter tibetensis TaxID=2972951 RepID=UPI00214DA12C|nr:ABC transporter permease [Parapedobacter tibetensis]
MLFLRLIGESFGFAFSALRENRTRTLLSLLGVTIGILIIIGVFSAVDTLRANLESSVEKLGSKTIYVMKWPWDGGPDFPWWQYVNRPEPDIRDYEALKTRMTTANGISFSIDIGNRTAQHLNNNVSGITVTATSHELYDIRNLEIQHGRYFTEAESNRGTTVAVIGATVAEGLFPNTDPVGQAISVLGRKITVIGVFKEEGEGMIFDVSMDNVVMIPLNLGRNLVNIRRYSPAIMVSAAPNISLDEAESELRGVMRSIHRLSPQQEDDFSLNKTTIITAQLDAMFKVINTAGGFIGIFSILVGGFGIANIMFVSVKERTHIIGIQKSLGAKNYFILSQFLIEAIALCIIGGLMGLGIVFLLTFLVKLIFGLGIVVNMGMVMLTIGLSTFIGLLSGIIPAIMAARLDPVEAIRSK